MTETELSFCEVGIEAFREIWGVEVYRGCVPVYTLQMRLI